VQILRSSERLLAALHSLEIQLGRTRVYLADPGCNRAVGDVRLSQLKAKHSGILALLRANRLEARQLLGAAAGIEQGRGQ
jgi:hypothetical protein